MRKTLRSLLMQVHCLLLLACLGASTSVAAEVDREYAIKAAFIYNVAKFVSWPKALEKQFNLCVFEPNPFGDSLDALERRRLQSLPIVAQIIQSEQELGRCSLVFVSTDHQANYAQIITTAKEYSSLTIGEDPSFVSAGGIVALIREQGRVQVYVNQQRAKEAGWILSANLLELAHVVE